METTTSLVGHTEIPFLHLPANRGIFRNRAVRLRQLAASQSSLTGYLMLMAELAECQERLSKGVSLTRTPNAGTSGPILDASTWRRDLAWRDTLRAIERDLNFGEGVLAVRLSRIRQAGDDELESWADSLLAADFDPIDPGLAPFVAAALQIHWTSAAALLDSGQIVATDPGYLCPVCGFLPVASVLQTGGSLQGLRYLVCGLCASEWHRPRIHCVHCGASKDVAYFAIEGAGEAVKAEACAACKTYLKVMNREKVPQVDPFADDLATLSLDVLMAEEGYQRLGFNPLLLPGA